MKVTDAHVHFWDIEKLTYPWLDNIPEIAKSYTLKEYNEEIENIAIENIVFVQCECRPDQYLNEIAYVSQLAQSDVRIRGIVTYFPLEENDIEKRLSDLLYQYPLVKGIRRLEEGPRSLYTSRVFLENIDLLQNHDLSFDICVKAAQLTAAANLIEARPDLRYVLDHHGKPNIQEKKFRDWREIIKRIAANPNVYCKLSGLVTEADWTSWKISDLQPYFETALELFGIDRIMFGSDWPVVKLASPYTKWYDAARRLCENIDAADQKKIFYHNALDFYRITKND